MKQSYGEKELKTILMFSYLCLKLFSSIFNFLFLFCKFPIFSMILSLDKYLAM